MTPTIEEMNQAQISIKPFWQCINGHKSEKEAEVACWACGKDMFLTRNAKQEPYYNMGIEWLKCFFGLHEWIVSEKYRATLFCFRCGKRKTGQKHY